MRREEDDVGVGVDGGEGEGDGGCGGGDAARVLGRRHLRWSRRVRGGGGGDDCGDLARAVLWGLRRSGRVAGEVDFSSRAGLNYCSHQRDY